MKKILLSSLASILVLSACSTNEEMLLPPVQENVSALATAPSKEMKMNKEEAKVAKKSEIALKGGKDLGTKTSNSVKNATELKVTFKDIKASNSSEQIVAATANFALRSMEQARTWDSGAQIGYKALEDLGRQDVYVAKLTYYAAKAAKTWEDAYKIMVLGLSNIASQTPNTPKSSCDLVLTMLDKVKTWESGAKSGYAAIEFIAQTDNAEVKNFLNTVYRSAKAAKTWEDAYKTITNGLRDLKTLF